MSDVRCQSLISSAQPCSTGNDSPQSGREPAHNSKLTSQRMWLRWRFRPARSRESRTSRSTRSVSKSAVISVLVAAAEPLAEVIVVVVEDRRNCRCSRTSPRDIPASSRSRNASGPGGRPRPPVAAPISIVDGLSQHVHAVLIRLVIPAVVLVPIRGDGDYVRVVVVPALGAKLLALPLELRGVLLLDPIPRRRWACCSCAACCCATRVCSSRCLR